MADDIADNLEESLEDVIYRLEGMVKETIDTVRPLPSHINTLISEIANLKLLAAAKEIPATVADEAAHAGKVVGSAGETAAAGVTTVPAAATDVIEDVQGVGGEASKGAGQSWRQFKLKKNGRK